MFIVDTDTMFYRVGFTNPPSPESACNQLSAYIETVLNRAKGMFPTVYESCVLVYGIDTGTRYRDQFATKIKYKANRDSSRKPSFIQEMKEFVFSNYPAIQVQSHECEADDYVSILAHKYIASDSPGEYCIVGADKDLNQIPGKHYNFLKDTGYVLTQEQADRFFFEQLLSGDIADNIEGLGGVGPKRAIKYLSVANNPEDWWQIVLDKYSAAYSVLSEDMIAEMLYERGNLLWIQRHEGQTWYPPIPETPSSVGGTLSLPF